MGDPQRYRTKAEVEEWKPRGPISRFQERLELIGLAREDDFKDIEEKVEGITDEAVRFAETSPFPEPDALYTDVLVEEA